jgi:hypothetical protein
MKKSERLRFLRAMKFAPQLSDVCEMNGWPVDLDHLLLACRLCADSLELSVSVGIPTDELKELLREDF